MNTNSIIERRKTVSNIPEQWIKGCVQKGWLDYSNHAKCRMKERQIEDNKIIECILYGKVIELQLQFEDVHVVFQEATESKPEIYVVIAAAYPFPLVVTVCRTIDEVWGIAMDIKRRKRKC